MDYQLFIHTFSYVFGGLFIFLLGMKNMSEGMQAIAGERLRRMISAVTDNRFMACASGAGITCLIQSSSVTSVMVIGMVNAGVMTLRQALGVILGADIGTTITAWIVAIKVCKYGLPVLGLSGLVFLFTRDPRRRYFSMMIMGIGMVFFGLDLMNDAFLPLRNKPEFIGFFSAFKPKDYVGVLKCVLVGSFVTAVIQSSSATIAITITLARTGVIDFETAVALVLGQNIGTTITAYLASIGTSTNAKRSAYGHVLIKILGVALMIPPFFIYVQLINSTIDPNIDIAKKIALSHTLFNFLVVCLFLPLIGFLVTFLNQIVHEKPHKESPHLAFIDVRLLETPVFGIKQSFSVILSMAESVREMMNSLWIIIRRKNNVNIHEEKIFHTEQVLDLTEKNVVEFLSKLLSCNISSDVLLQARMQLRMADEYESISDYIVNILKLNLKIRKSGLKMSEEANNEIHMLHCHVLKYIEMVNQSVKENNSDILSYSNTQSQTINHEVKNYRRDHLARLEEKKCTANNALIYGDILTSYLRIKDHALNISEVIAGQK